MRKETDPVSETFCSLAFFRITDEGQRKKKLLILRKREVTAGRVDFEYLNLGDWGFRSFGISRRLVWQMPTERMGEKRNAYKILLGKSEGKSPLGRPRRRWIDNIKMYLREMEWCGLD
jgi:hypothetical protein